jgi:hypothetical protein
MILLFQSYTGGRPAEFVYSSKGKTSEDPLGEAKETSKNKRPRGKRNKHDNKSINADDSLEYNDNSDTSDSPKYDDNLFFDSNDNKTADEDNMFDESTDESADRDSGYNSNRADIIMTEDTDDYYLIEVDEAGQPV